LSFGCETHDGGARSLAVLEAVLEESDTASGQCGFG
jgi:hypothetical protein